MKKLIMKLFAAAFAVVGISGSVCAAPAITLETPEVKGSQITVSGNLSGGYINEIAYYVVRLENGVEEDNYAAVGQQNVNGEEFSAQIKMGSSAKSGKYRLLTASVKSEEKSSIEFDFISEEERKLLIEELSADNMTEEQIKGILTNEENIPVLTAMGCLTSDLSSLSDSMKTEAVKLIKSGLNGYFKKPYGETDFMTLYNYVTAYTSTVLDTQANVADRLMHYADIFGIDKEGIKNSTLLTQKIRNTEANSIKDVANVYNETIAVIAFNDELDFNNVSNLIEKYKEVLGLDTRDYNSLSSDAKTKVHKAMISSDYTSAAEVKSKFNSAVDEAAKVPIHSGGGSGGSSGGGSSTSSYIPPVKPTEKVENSEQKPVFRDIDGYEWAREAIETLAKYNIISGIGDDLFEPSRQIKREEFVKILVSAFNMVNTNAACSFEDVSADDWYYIYVASAVESGIVSGKTQESFGAGDYITRQEIAALLERTAQKQAIEFAEEEEKDFTDMDKIAEYAKGAVLKLASSGIISGREDGTFAPMENASRAEAAKLVYGLWTLKFN